MSYEEVREEARALARDAWYKVDANDDGFQAIADAILSHPRIAVLSEDQTLPESPWGRPVGNTAALRLTTGYDVALRDMSDFRRVEKP